MIGSPHHEATGAADVFRRHANGAWMPETTLFAAEAAPRDCVGHAVAVSNGVALIGAEDSTYIFGLCPGDVDGDGTVSITDLGWLLASFGMQGRHRPMATWMATARWVW